MSSMPPSSKKSLGQHFLSDPRILERIVAFSGVGDADTVVEIGPGRGSLSLVLARRVHRLIAVEVDADLIPRLADLLPENAELVQADALGLDFHALMETPYHVVSNLPYNIATPLLARFIEARRAISSVTVLLQKEVADRTLSGPGSRQYGPLSVGVQYHAEVEKGFVVPAGAFSPRPKIDSRVIRLRWRQVPDVPGFADFVGKAFRSRRKKLARNLENLTGEDRQVIVTLLESLGIAGDARPEDVGVDQFVALYRRLR
jgi:16S rRNA (adenine1518-N6/adenine1519-N6)-dimethyltransferase